MGAFTDVNCAAIPETLLEAELFGFEAGTFTDARRAKPGLFEAASGGTLYLDELDTLPLFLQGKFVQAVEAKRLRRLGTVAEQEVDVKIIVASQTDLRALIDERRFRADLYHRLAVVVLHIPPYVSVGMTSCCWRAIFWSLRVRVSPESEAPEQGRGQLVGVVGEAGIGTSRLLREWQRELAEQQATYLEGVASPTHRRCRICHCWRSCASIAASPKAMRRRSSSRRCGKDCARWASRAKPRQLTCCGCLTRQTAGGYCLP